MPSSRPGLSQDRARAILKEHGVADRVTLIGMRGYFRDSMGKKGANDRNLYDDAIILVSPYVFATFNANTDPSAFRRAIAVLTPGTWQYKLGTHGLGKPRNKRYTALVQAGEVTVKRDDDASAATSTGTLDTGYFGINIHRGGYNTTSSLGCQTIYPDQWAGFIGIVEQELQRSGQVVLPYVLVEQQG